MLKSADTEEVCIVSCGCVLPDASNPEEFWHNIVNNRRSFAPLPESRWKKRLFYSTDRKDCDTTYSNYGAFISDAILEPIKERFSHVHSPTRLQLLALDAVRQAFASTKYVSEKTSMYIGCMSCDESAGIIEFSKHDNEYVKQNMSDEDFQRYRDIERWDSEYCRNACINSSVLHMLQNEFGIQGFSTLIDGACASSLVAISMGVSALRIRETDCAIVAGIDANLGPETFVIFCRAGVMAETKSVPFSTLSEGLLQGEGAVVFVMKRLSDALSDGDTIYAVIRGVGISSSGRASSLFEPSVSDQLLAYERAYGHSHIPSLDFIEAHATGTAQGDNAELQSLHQFFPGQRIALSSVKAMIGHTKATAGAAGVLKSILMMKYRLIPPFLLSDGSRITSSMLVYLPQKTIKLENEIIHGGVSAFGFGGINAHLYLSSLSKDDREPKRSRSQQVNSHNSEDDESVIVLVGHSSVDMNKLSEMETGFDLRIPLKSYPQVDPLQRLGVIAVKQAFDSAGIHIHLLDCNNIGVISASATGQEVFRNLGYRLNYAQMNAPFDEERYGKNVLLALRSRYPPATEDTGPGMLNNVIAGRVANYFDFHHLTCNIDYDEASESSAFVVAKTHLLYHGGFVIVIASDDLFDAQFMCFKSRKVNVYLLTTLSYAQQYLLPIISVLKEIRFDDR